MDRATVAVFILLVACINYMNLCHARARAGAAPSASARFSARAALRSRGEFLGESLLFSLIAVVLGIMLVEVMLRLTPLNSLLGEQVRLNLTEGASCCSSGCWGLGS